MSENFGKDLESLLNQHCIENESNTPDFILANYLKLCLEAFRLATVHRDSWYGVHLSPGNSFFERDRP